MRNFDWSTFNSAEGTEEVLGQTQRRGTLQSESRKGFSTEMKGRWGGSWKEWGKKERITNNQKVKTQENKPHTSS